MAWVAAAAAIAGTALQGYGMIEQGQATAQNARYQAQVAKLNAQIAEQNAERASESGMTRAQIIGLQNANTAGKIKAGQAANNIDVNTGSAVKVQAGQKIAGRFSELTEENNALLQAYGYRVAAKGDLAQAQLNQQEAGQAVTGSYLGAAGGILSNASALAFKWAPMQDGGGGTGSTTPPPETPDPLSYD